jgi:hypothetical protein
MYNLRTHVQELNIDLKQMKAFSPSRLVLQVKVPNRRWVAILFLHINPGSFLPRVRCGHARGPFFSLKHECLRIHETL